MQSDTAPETASAQGFLVGGVRLPRPFRVRRLGHFGINVNDPEVSRVFYEDLLGLRVTDRLDLTGRLPEEELLKHGPRIGYFTRCNAEHHCSSSSRGGAVGGVRFQNEFRSQTTRSLAGRQLREWSRGSSTSARRVCDPSVGRDAGLELERLSFDLTAM